MTEPRHLRIEPAPTPEEAAAIVAALEVMGRDGRRRNLPRGAGGGLAGLLGHPVPPGMRFEGSLWSFSRWGGGF
jgi:hypothetical protein